MALVRRAVHTVVLPVTRRARWTADDLNRVKSAKPFKDKYGNTVWARRNGDTWDWIVENSDGVIISARKGEGLRSAQLAAREFMWPKGILP